MISLRTSATASLMLGRAGSRVICMLYTAYTRHSRPPAAGGIFPKLPIRQGLRRSLELADVLAELRLELCPVHAGEGPIADTAIAARVLFQLETNRDASRCLTGEDRRGPTRNRPECPPGLGD